MVFQGSHRLYLYLMLTMLLMLLHANQHRQVHCAGGNDSAKLQHINKVKCKCIYQSICNKWSVHLVNRSNDQCKCLKCGVVPLTSVYFIRFLSFVHPLFFNCYF